jgi:hypothetical protein
MCYTADILMKKLNSLNYYDELLNINIYDALPLTVQSNPFTK